MDHASVDSICALTVGILTGIYFIYLIFFNKE